ncbi:MAG: caspase family protein [Rhizobiaceae bacterium]
MALIRFFLIVCVVLATMAGVASAQQKSLYNGDQKRVALVIGVGAYQYTDELPNPVNDARAMADALTRLGFEVMRLENPSVGDFEQIEFELYKRLKGADVGLLFYAGHSVQVDGSNYLIPVDAQLENFSSLANQTFELAKYVNLMDDLAKTKIIILDACRDNPMAELLQQSMEGEGDSRAIGVGLGQMDYLVQKGQLEQSQVDTYGTVISYAAAPGRVAEDGLGDHSPFTTALLKRIEEPGLEIGRMLRGVAADVIGETSGGQRPEYLVKLTDEFYFLVPEPSQCDYLAVEPYNNLSIKGVDFDAIKSKEAIAACQQALEKEPDHPRLLHNLARALDARGSYSESIPFYKKSAAQGYIHAINNLGVMYINGQGVKQDFEKGAELLRQATARGHQQSRVNLQGSDFSVVMGVDEFTTIQQELKTRGFYSGVLDGDFGSGSKSALQLYQTEFKLKPNGLTLETLDHLGLIGIIPNFSVN